MFKWLLKMFDTGQKEAEEVSPKEEHREKDISEPVYSFVETVKKDRKRFIFEKRGWRFTCYDTYKDKCFVVTRFSGACAPLSENVKFLTTDELEYLFDEIERHFNTLTERRNRILKARKNRENLDKREECCKIYCK